MLHASQTRRLTHDVFLFSLWLLLCRPRLLCAQRMEVNIRLLRMDGDVTQYTKVQGDVEKDQVSVPRNTTVEEFEKSWLPSNETLRGCLYYVVDSAGVPVQDGTTPLTDAMHAADAATVWVLSYAISTGRFLPVRPSPPPARPCLRFHTFPCARA